MVAFLAVASAGKFTDAASQLFISQSALSKQIGKLEEELGVQLFSKTRNGVELTQAGWDFYAYARKAVREYQDAKERLRGFSDNQTRSLSFGCLPLSREYGIEEAIAQYWAQHPLVQIEFRERSQKELLKLLDIGPLDLALVRMDLMDEEKFELQPILEDELVVACPTDHPLAHRKEVPIASLRNERFVLLEAKSDITQRFVLECEKAGFFPNTPLHSSRHRLVLKAVQRGLGITVMPKRMVEAFLAGDIATVPLREHLFTTLGFARARQQDSSQLVEDFVRVIRENLRNQGSLSYNYVDYTPSTEQRIR
jgi:LysR family transcriptional activator of glutamate synthase operon